MSRNSFHLKGWNVVLVSALFALAANNAKSYFIYLAYFPVIAFWILDGYYLWQEKLFRALYNHIRVLEEEEIDFSMDTSIIEETEPSWWDVVCSKTLVIFYGTIFGSILIVMILFIFINLRG